MGSNNAYTPYALYTGSVVVYVYARWYLCIGWSSLYLSLPSGFAMLWYPYLITPTKFEAGTLFYNSSKGDVVYSHRSSGISALVRCGGG